MLTLGWSDGQTFIPLDFALLSSSKSQIICLLGLDYIVVYRYNKSYKYDMKVKSCGCSSYLQCAW